ncbi:MAG: hypothetical protein RLZZ557_2208 [Bacteroidota bacterium]
MFKLKSLISIDSILISDDIVEEQFVCDLTQCKGGCCEDGDAGAPLTDEELDEVKQAFEKVMHLMPKDGLKEVERNGLYRYDREFGWVTPTVDDKICAYGFRDAKGVIKCAFEEAYNQGLISWKKPISCHLYPIKRSKSRFSAHELLNYDPREGMCSPACSLGKSLKVPVYRFLKDALVRAYGTEFYDALDQVAQDYYSIPQKEGKK